MQQMIVMPIEMQKITTQSNSEFEFEDFESNSDSVGVALGTTVGKA